MKESDDKECKLQIGDVCISLRFKDTAFSSYLREYFKGYTCKEPELIVDMNIEEVSDKEFGGFECDLLSLHPKTVKGNSFNLLSGEVTGTLNLKEKRCTVYFSRKGIRIFKQFMFMIYYTLMKHNHPAESKNSFLVHACGVSKDGYGYAFVGPSESGKSTIAKLSSDYTVLNDEIIIIKKKREGYIVRSTPFRGDFLENRNGSAPLKAIFIINHGKKNIIRGISKGEFISQFLKEVVCPDSLLPENRGEMLLEMLDFCADVARNVPFYELRFIPDKSFWSCIDEIVGV